MALKETPTWCGALLPRSLSGGSGARCGVVRCVVGRVEGRVRMLVLDIGGVRGLKGGRLRGYAC